MSLAVSRKRDRVQEFERLCRAHNLSLTVQRRAVFETLLEGPQHVSADAIHQAVQAKIPGLSKTTVYRVLDTLVEIGVVKKIYQPGAPALFDFCTHPHHHLACLTCGKVLDVDIDELSLPTLPPDQTRGFEITEAHVFLRGTCPECLKKRGKSDGGPDHSAPSKSEASGAPDTTKRGDSS